ncbi:MAG: gliding motility protein GldM, partial [Sphingobacteriales bacterium]|nr:gliding motility protein GldM [Sphingobacteriales bacterium]
MSLPKEPRQKMINIMYLVLTALLALNVSSEILNAFLVVDKSLTTSNQNLTTANSTLYESLKAKMEDPGTAEKAKLWNDKAMEAKKLSTEMNTYIEELKKELLLEAGLHKNDEGQEEYKHDDLEAATRLFGEGEGGKKKGPEFEAKLKAYRSAMLKVDTTFEREYAKTFPLDVSQPIGQDGKPKDFTVAYFHM